MDKISREIKDFLFVGSGVSSLVALHNIDTKKYDCAVVSLGNGSSPFIHGISIPITKEDSIEKYYQEFLLSSHFQCDKELAKTLTYNSLNVVDFIKSIGLDFNKDKNGNYEVLKPLGMNYPRVVSIKNELGHIVQTKLKEDKVDEVEFISGKLIKIFKNGNVFASIIALNNKEIKIVYSKGILIASGGFSKLYSFSTNSFDLSGDALFASYDIGASLCDLEFVQFEPSVAVYPTPLVGKSVITTLFYSGATLENSLNERFMFNYSKDGERVNKDLMSKAIAKEIKEGRVSSHGGVYFNATGVDKDLLLTSYKSYYDRYKNVGIDISKEKMEIAPGAHTTLGGIKANKDCLSEVNGLFVCGEAMGGVHGANRMGGCAGLETFVFGDIAGKSINKFLTSNFKRIDKNDLNDIDIEVNKFINSLVVNDKDYSLFKKELGNILTNNFGVIRNKVEMLEGYKKALNMLNKLEKEEKSLSLVSLISNLSLALLMMQSALNREKSVGCHYIKNINEDDNEPRYQIVINKSYGIRKEQL
ncbi:MAG: FAD-binding protein [Bacilli bacterium]